MPPKHKKGTRVFRLIFASCVVAYLLAVGVIFALPHRMNGDGFGRMNAYRLFANIGYAASFGLMDFRLIDWYYAPIERYDSLMWRNVLLLTPLFLAWSAIAGVVGQVVSNRFLESGHEAT